MPVIKFQSNVYEVKDRESVLDCLLRHNCKVAFSCQEGRCKICMMHAINGVPTKKSQIDMEEVQIKKGYFLACQCIPEEDMHIGILDDN